VQGVHLGKQRFLLLLLLLKLFIFLFFFAFFLFFFSNYSSSGIVQMLVKKGEENAQSKSQYCSKDEE
jgi:parvulin-like peptidyl-prolyl isomerase